MQRILSVTFNEGHSSKRYEYEYEGDQIPEVGDLAIVYVGTNFYSDSGYKITTVREVKSLWEQGYDGSLKKVIGLISLAEQRREAERKKRRADLERQLDKIVKSRSKEIIYEQIARTDPEAARILAELRQL